MANQVNTLVVSALRIAASYQAKVAELRAALPRGLDRDAIADALRPGVAQFYGIKLETKSTGRVVFPVDHADTEAARRSLQRLVKAVIGEVVQHKAPVKVRVAGAERTAFNALLDACGGDYARLQAVIRACKPQ